MKNRRYKVLRSRVYYGEVIVPHQFVYEGSVPKSVYEYRPVRSCLFELTSDGYANDLLNKVDNYPVFRISDVPLEDYAILNPVCLNDVLEYLGYLEELGYKDIVSIRNQIFNCDFVSEHMEFFGFKEVDGKMKFQKDNRSVLELFSLNKLDNLKKRSFGEVLLHSGECMDPFKAKFEEKKKKLTLC